MLNVGGQEILLILVVALIFLGPERLPTMGRQIGKALAQFRQMTSGVQRDLKDALDVDGVRESIDTFREVVDVRKTLATEFASVLSSTGAPLSTTPTPTSSNTAPTNEIAPHTSTQPSIPPPDGAYTDERAENALLGGVSVDPPRLGGFEDILAGPTSSHSSVRAIAWKSWASCSMN